MCFDLMVEACHNLACRWHGVEDAYLCLHAHTHQLMQYCVWHKFGISKDYNTYNQHPWHGTGQGATNVALRYIVLSDTLIDTYHSKIEPHLLYDPMHHTKILRSLKAFINNVVIHTHQPVDESMQALQLCTQEKLTWWDKLVKVTSSELNPQNCCGLLYMWAPNQCGILQLCILNSRCPSFPSHSKMSCNLLQSSKTTKVQDTWDFILPQIGTRNLWSPIYGTRH